jgi:hypothetical protein
LLLRWKCVEFDCFPAALGGTDRLLRLNALKLKLIAKNPLEGIGNYGVGCLRRSIYHRRKFGTPIIGSSYRRIWERNERVKLSVA